MNYPKDIELKLGFTQIREQLVNRCQTDIGKELLSKIKFSFVFEEVNNQLNQTKEYLYLISSAESVPSMPTDDIRDALKKSLVEGDYCDALELLHVAFVAKSIDNHIKFFLRNKDKYPHIDTLIAELNVDGNISKTIFAAIDENGDVRDDASPTLREIRAQLKDQYVKVRRALQSIYKSSVKEGFVPEGASLTVRNGRMVIPILAEHKRRITGFIHDESASGNTVYLEPSAVLQGNNEIRELEYTEKREILKILISLTTVIRQNHSDLIHGIEVLGQLDVIRAKARMSQHMGAIIPKLKNKPAIGWINAIHPLLNTSLKKEGKSVVPLSISLNEEHRILVISGPNAGGKSVSLKTVGLLQYMIQCGIPVPMDEGSICGFFSKIMVDIGDEQSIENDLSTYSSHLKNVKHFVDHGDHDTLLLIDEFGTGTDPHFGGAIAQAVLDSLANQNVFGVVTTHYGNIKNFAQEKKGLINGAMKYDMQRLIPLFELEIGKPGSSFSLEIAKKIGLKRALIDYAKELIGDKNINVDELLNKLSKQQQEIDTKQREMKSKEEEVKNLMNQYRQLKNQIESQQKQIISKAKEEASHLLRQTNKEIEKTIRHIKSNNAQKSETKKARQRLDMFKSEVAPKEKVVKPIKPPDEALKVGDYVKLIDQEVTGQITAIKGVDVEVQIGLLKSKIKKNRLEKISKGAIKAIERNSQNSANLNLMRKLATFNSQLDVRGHRAEVVMGELEKFLDDAILFGLYEVKVLHGKGNGVLRELVRNYAKQQQFVASFTDEHVDRGGAGITIITLK